MVLGRSTKGRTLFGFILMAVLCSRPPVTNAHCSQHESDRVCYYVIHNSTDSGFRKASILIDEADFTEAKLRQLMDQFRGTYTEPNILIFLYSKLDQLYAFNGNEPVGSSHAVENKAPQPWNRNAKGIFIDRGVDQVIRYNTSGTELQTIIVQGVDPWPQ